MIRTALLATLLFPLPLLAEPGPGERSPVERSAAAALSGLTRGFADRDMPDGSAPAGLALPLVAAPRPAVSQEPVSQADVLRAELRPGWREADGRYMAALHLNLAPHWKTYWRAPGDAGIPPEFDWSGSENLQSVTLHWPQPEVFDYQGMQTIGYLTEVVLPVEVTPVDPSRAVVLRVAVDLGVCNDICMPAALTLQEPLPAAGPSDPLIRKALAQRPLTAAEAGVSSLACAVEQTGKSLRVTARIGMPPLPGAETVVMEPAGGVWVSDTEAHRAGGILTAVAEIVPPRDGAYLFDPAALRLTVLAEGRAVEMTGCALD